MFLGTILLEIKVAKHLNDRISLQSKKAMFVLCVTTTGKLSLTIILFSEGEENISEYLLRRRRGKYPAIFTKPEVNNCFGIIFRGEYEEHELG